MTTLIINIAVAVFALCALLIVANQRIKKPIAAWVVLIGSIVSAIAMVVNQAFYDVTFACFASFASSTAVYVTYRVYQRGSL